MEVEKLLDELITELSDAGIAKQQQLISQLIERCSEILKVLPFAIELANREKIGILHGVLFAQKQSRFVERIQIANDQKQMLAKYVYSKCKLHEYVDSLGGEFSVIPSIFFESGSTIAYAFGYFAMKLHKKRRELQKEKIGHEDDENDRLNCSILTNHFYALTALSGLVSDVEPIQGRLSLSYAGFFPFEKNDPSTTDKWHREGQRYKTLAEDIAQCDTLFTTCSNFSFLLGATVGSRANCLTKSAIYYGLAREDQRKRQLFLMFHFEKLIPVLNNAPTLKFDLPKEHCKRVFPVPNNFPESMRTWLNQIGGDSISWEENGWHGRVISNGDSPTPIEILKNKWGMRESAINTTLVSQSWIEWLQNVDDVHLLISLPVALPSDDERYLKTCIQFLRAEIRRSHDIYKLLGRDVKWQIVNESEMEQDKVIHLAKVIT